MLKIDYPRLYGWTASHPRLLGAMKAAHIPAVIFVALSYGVHVAVSAWLGSLTRALILLAVSSTPFLLVSILRILVNRTRPYEVYDLDAMGLVRPREKGGRSFPSRHVFSAFLIGSLLLADAPILGAIVLLLGVYIAVYRVVVGAHFLSDALAGAFVGAITGAFGALCLHLFC